jgi:hypothetical protein
MQRSLKSLVAVALLLSASIAGSLAQTQDAARAPRAPGTERLPVIDMALAAATETQWAEAAGTPNPVTGKPAPATAEEHMRESLAMMRRHNVVVAVVGGSLEAIEMWRRAAPERVLPALALTRPGFGAFQEPLPDLDALQVMFRDGRLKAMSEIGAQYEGLSASDPAYEPYFALAEEVDIPVGIHTGTSFSGTTARSPRFRVALGNPILLEDLLVRHPALRVNMVHGGAPWTREAIAVMQQYPQVYMDLSPRWLARPESRAFDQELRELFEAGLGDRVMFATDQMLWPEAIGMAIEMIESNEYLSAEQKRDVLYHNAARFLRLAEEEIARHHGR